MSVFDRRRAEALARELDALGAQGPAAGHPTPAAALALQLRAASVGLAERTAPRPEFRDDLRTRLVAVATVRPVTAPEPARTPARAARRGAAVAAGALASVVAVSGVAVASSASLPGEPFYDVKRAAEGVQLALAGDAAAEGERHLQFAATRLDEVDGLVLGRGADEDGDGPDWARVQATLADMDDATRAGSTLIAEAWQSTGDRELLDLLSGFTAEQSAGLAALLPAMGPAALEQAQSSLALVDALAGATRRLAGAPAPGGGPAAPGAPSTPTVAPPSPATGDPAVPPSGSATPPAGPGGPSAPAGEPDRDGDPAPPPPPPGDPRPPTGVPSPLPVLPSGAPVPPAPTSTLTPRTPSLGPVLDPLLSPPPLPGAPTG